MIMRIQSETLARYGSIADASGRMVEAARRNDWDAVALEEKRCRDLVAALKKPGGPTLPETEHAQKHAIIRKVLADDAEIRNLADPWLKHLESVLSASGNNRKLDESYGRLP
jgi:flagellar protein FliT